MGTKRNKVEGLIKARILDECPSFIPDNNKNTRSQADGLRYERKVAKKLTALLGEDRVIHGPWIEYLDKRGKGWCQPDLVIFNRPTPINPEKETGPLILLECKLSATVAAERKIKNFYRPCLELVYPNCSIKSAMVTKNLRAGWKPTVDNLDELLETDDDFSVWNWRNP